ncbi:MAG: PIN domain-containing protein [Clostridiales bacterium]|jgi:predicted nucleic acid-binding protein|nr:PIN domain-containing protein [Clostridiales bacterium]
MIYALDTNIVSYIIRGEGEADKRFSQELQAGNSFAIPPMAVYELKRWLMDNPSKEMRFLAREFDSLYKSVRHKSEMSASAWEEAAKIYIHLKQKGELIEDMHILIASYCLVNDYVLATNNARHFDRIDGIKYVNWMN